VHLTWQRLTNVVLPGQTTDALPQGDLSSDRRRLVLFFYVVFKDVVSYLMNVATALHLCALSHTMHLEEVQ